MRLRIDWGLSWSEAVAFRQDNQADIAARGLDLSPNR